MLIRWTPSAFRDLQNAHEYIRLRDAKAASKFAGDIRCAMKRLADHPESGPVADDLEPVGDYRHVLVQPFRVIYLLDQGAVVILRVWDSRRNPDDLRV
jgi:toxin ParE1/3/4